MDADGLGDHLPALPGRLGPLPDHMLPLMAHDLGGRFLRADAGGRLEGDAGIVGAVLVLPPGAGLALGLSGPVQAAGPFHQRGVLRFGVRIRAGQRRQRRFRSGIHHKALGPHAEDRLLIAVLNAHFGQTVRGVVQLRLRGHAGAHLDADLGGAAGGDLLHRLHRLHRRLRLRPPGGGRPGRAQSHIGIGLLPGRRPLISVSADGSDPAHFLPAPFSRTAFPDAVK